MPVFWLALILQHLFFPRLGWLPIAGSTTPRSTSRARSTVRSASPIVDALMRQLARLPSSLTHLVLPALTVAAYPPARSR